MLPHVIGPLLILASMDVPVVVTIEAGLSFLGLVSVQGEILNLLARLQDRHGIS